jgi:hypothetical protein
MRISQLESCDPAGAEVGPSHPCKVLAEQRRWFRYLKCRKRDNFVRELRSHDAKLGSEEFQPKKIESIEWHSYIGIEVLHSLRR